MSPRKLLPFFLVIAGLTPVPAQESRAMLVRRIAAGDSASEAELSRIFSWGSRAWEPVRTDPLVVAQRDAEGHERSCFFALEAGGFLTAPPHSPAAGRERRFAADVERALKEEGGAPWPIFVFSGPNKRKVSLDAVSLASTMRIIVRDWKGSLTPASAIVLNSEYWDVTDAAPEWVDDRFSAMVAKHEVYHARLAWLRAGEIGAHADEIETRLRGEGAPCHDRSALESLIGQAITASEEVSAIDASLNSAAMPSYRRQSILEYRERNAGIERKAVRAIAALFPSSKSGKVVEKWLGGFLSERIASGKREQVAMGLR